MKGDKFYFVDSIPNSLLVIVLVIKTNL